jgi:hypothetical protein
VRGLGALQVGSQAHLSIIVPADGMIAAVGLVTSACPPWAALRERLLHFYGQGNDFARHQLTGTDLASISDTLIVGLAQFLRHS